jgi:hypothetical protein
MIAGSDFAGEDEGASGIDDIDRHGCVGSCVKTCDERGREAG